MADLKSTAGGGEEKRHSRRPVWRSLKVATNTGHSNESHNKHAIISTPLNKNKDQLETSGEQTNSRLSNWLSQQLHEHERQAHYSPTWIDDRETPTMSNLSLVSHVSSASDSSDLRKRPMSVPTSPASPTIPRFLMTPVTSNPSNSPAAPSQPRLLTVMTAKMIPPSSPTTSAHSETISYTPPHTKANYQTKPLPSSSTSLLGNAHYDGDYETDSEDDENDDTYKTAGESTDYSDDMGDRLDEINDCSEDMGDRLDEINDCSEDMDDRLDEINDYSDNSIYYINRYYDDHNNNRPHDDNRITKTAAINGDRDFDNDICTNSVHNKDEYITTSRHNSSNSDMKDAHNKSIFDSMDPEVAQILLEWRRQSLLKIDWFDMFATKSDLWRSTTLFLTPEQQQQQQGPSSSSSPSYQSSIATTSLDSLHFKGVPLDKAFRSYNKRIDYAKASVSDIDHALQVFAQLYWECNPSKLFQCAELVYIIIHSLMSLNTDVHAGQEHTTMDGFCKRTIDLVLAHQASIPIMLFDANGENTWHQAMTECLQSLYKSVKRSSLLQTNQLQPLSLVTTVQRISTHDDVEQPQEENELSTIEKGLDTAFNDLFITTTDITHSNPKTTVAPKKSISTPQKKSKQRHQRSNSLASTPSWTLLRRKDTYRSRFGPYKEGPLSCQLNGEPWKICWVILHLGHLHIYHHQLDETIPTTPTLENHANIPLSPPLPSKTNKSNKVKKRFMQHLSPTATVTHSATNFNSSSNHGQVLKKKKPYQEVDIHLGNTFCEKYGPHVFLLQLANGSNTYIFDCGSESQVTAWIRDINFWAARETKIVLSRGSSSSASISTSSIMWKRPPPPAGASVLDNQGQQQAIDTHLFYLQTELKHLLQQPGWVSNTWQDKKMYLELEIRKYQCYHDSIYQ